MRKLCLALFVLIAFTLAAAQQDKSKRPSPPGSAEVTLGGHKITVDYSRPSMKGRKVFGGLVPFGEPWRTGANEATSFKTDAALDIHGTTVPAGSYTLYTLPSAGAWKLIISKKTGQWGIPYPGESQDLARIAMDKKALSTPVEQFTISFDKKSESEAVLHFAWENTDVSVPIKIRK